MTQTLSPYRGFFSSLGTQANTRKPDFSSVPENLRNDLCRLVRAQRIISAETARGGISASAAFVVTFDTGARLFLKGSHPDELSHGAANLRGECAAYRCLNVLQDVAPSFVGMVHADNGDDNGWWLGAWQALDVRAQTSFDAAALFSLLDVFAGSDAPIALPLALTHPYLSHFMSDAHKWRRLRDEPARAEKFIAATKHPEAAKIWLNAHLAHLCDMQRAAANHMWRIGVMHGDLRCDNFIFARADAAQPLRWYVLDWANAAEGPLAFDRVMLAASLLAEGSVTPGEAAQRAMGNLDRADVSYMLVQQAGYFADQLYRAPPAAMAHLRDMQKAMAWALLTILAELGHVASPPVFTVG